MPKPHSPQPYFIFGLIAALSLTWAALEWTRFEWSGAGLAAASSMPLDLLEVEVIPTSTPVKPPPPKPLVNPLPMPDPKPSPIFVGAAQPDPDPVFFSGWDAILGTSPATPTSDEPETLLVADHMPAFDACVNVLDSEAERLCTEQRIIEYIQSCVEFPRLMKDAGMSGTVYVEYVIDETGHVRNARVLKSPHKAFEATTISCVEGLPALNPGRQQGRPVRVLYTLPVKFSLR
jgi:protein TonB